MITSKRLPVFYWFPVLVSIFLGFIFISIPPVAESYMSLFGVSYAGLSFFLSALFWSHALIQVPAGLIVDRLGVLYSLYLGLLLQIIPSLLPFLFPQSLWFAFCMRFIVGIGSGILFLAIVKAVILLAPDRYVERAQGLQGAAFSLGSMLPYLVLPVWGQWGWAVAYILSAVVGICILCITRYVLQDTLKQAPKVEKQSPAMVLRACLDTITNKQTVLLGCLHGFSFGTINTVSSWLPLLLKDLTTGENSIFWTMGAGGVFFAATLGRIFSGELGHNYTKIYVIFACTLISATLLLGLSLSDNPFIVLALGLGIGIICGLTYSSVFILAAQFAIPGYTATGIGTMNMLANFINIILTLILGIIREYANSFRPGLLFMACAAFAVLTLAFFSRKHLIPRRLE